MGFAGSSFAELERECVYLKTTAAFFCPVFSSNFAMSGEVCFMKIMKTQIKSCILTALFGVVTLQVYGQGTAFTYQGRLSDNGSPANGTYQFQVAIFDSASGGNQIGPTLANIFAVTSNGLFTVTLNFGANIFTGPSRWLEMGARTNGSAAPFTVLTPRQALLPTPYAILAGTISGVVNSSGLSGVYAGAL